ncbi:MAG: hypothetical protein FWG16_04280 [Micrococcales bacterium]|nr:hypothetical protein [Micrococcales bacterium]
MRWSSEQSSRRRLQPSPSKLLVVFGGLLLVVGLSPVVGAPTAWTAEPSSAKTVTAKAYDPNWANAPFPDLAVTVSQTTDLIAQGVTVSWTGAKQSRVPGSQEGGQNFLQIAQCWGDEPGSNGTRPDRTTCQYGGFNLPGAGRWWYRASSEVPLIPEEDQSFTSPPTWPLSAMTAIPFRSATGVTLSSIVDGVYVGGIDLNNNEFFTRFTTNEVSWAGSGADGSGSIRFELQTAQESPGLGCGAPIESGGSVKGASCWLVIIPRGESDPFSTNIIQSGLFQETWKHHLAIKLDFKPLGLRCGMGAAERLLSGSELVLEAVGQWQPVLCGAAKGQVFSLLTGPESDALAAATQTETSPLALASRALTDVESDPLVYAPIALTGVAIGFAIDSYHGPKEAPAKVVAREGHAFETLNLTPRLLAKLLTGSYKSALPTYADWSHLGSNPSNLTHDPDFLAVNDSDWTYMSLNGVGLADPLVPIGRSDTARTVWHYILADSEAVAFLAGEPDPWGMVVNPYYSTNQSLNPTGEALALPAEEFPKADPVEFPGWANNGFADVVNLITWRPYAQSLDQAGYLVLRGDSQALGSWDPQATPPKYNRAPRDLVGLQQVIGLTDTSAAARYQVVQASLRNPAGVFVAPTTETMLAAAAVMVPDPEQTQVVRFDPASSKAKAAAKAYPLTVPVYAAANPLMADAAVRADYATFIDYAATKGQQPGTDDGLLPPGYAPIPSDWQKQAKAAAVLIRNGPATGTNPTPSAKPPAVSPSPTPPSSVDPPGETPSPTATASPIPSTPAAPSPGPVGTTGDTAGSGWAPIATDDFQITPEVDSAVGEGDPAASGVRAAALQGQETPADPQVGALSAVVPTAGVASLLAGTCLPLVSRVRRKP